MQSHMLIAKSVLTRHYTATMSTATAFPRNRLPIGLQTLREIRERGCYYVDKSVMVVDLIESSGKAFFLSRPRRFGKSLLVDTFKELFEGHRALFEGLAAETRWDWSRRHPSSASTWVKARCAVAPNSICVCTS
jgi:hypothetical protein